MFLLTLLALTAIALALRPAAPPPQHLPQQAALVGYRIDINQSDAPTLAALPELGPSLAQRIVAFRAAHGPFASIDDLTRVPGIGPRTLERLRPFARVGPAVMADSAAGGA